MTTTPTPREILTAVLERRRPPRFACAPNYWQWFAHHRNHGTLPAELADARRQLDVIRHLGLDVFSRNVYCDEQEYWFGGLAAPVWDAMEEEATVRLEGRDRVKEIVYRTRAGTLTERLRYRFNESTLVQEKFAVDDYERQLDAAGALLEGRRWRFDPARYAAAQAEVGDDGYVMAGELFSPLKMLHLLMGPQNTTYLLVDYPERAAAWMALHERAQLELVRQMAEAGVRVMIAMDNLDAVFHTPEYVEKYSASFYERASRICHEVGSLFFIHACGRQRANLARIAGYGVDGLEGVAFPPLGDVELDEAARLSGERFILTGGISAAQTGRLRTRGEVGAYVRELLRRMAPHAHRFVLSASCNTPIDTPWETLVHFRDAWREHGGLE